MDDLFLSTLIGFADAGIGKLAKLYLEEASTISQIKTKIDAIFATKEIPQEFIQTFALIKEAAQNAPYMEDFEHYITYMSNTTGLKEDALLTPLRFLLTGAKEGPEFADLYAYLKHYLKEILR
jgi:glutamyl-tRNA synthetase